MPVEKSGQNEFDFEYGDDFGAHIEKFDPDFSKVLVRYNPDDDPTMNERQLGAAQGARRLAARQRSQVPVRAAGAGHRRPARERRRRQRPLRRRAAARADAPRDRGHPALRDRGRHLEDRGRRRPRRRRDARRAARSGEGREGVTCVLLGRGASTEKVEQWLEAAATVDGLHRLRDRPLDLVGRAQGLSGQRPRALRRPPRRSPTTTCISCRSTRASRSPERSRQSGTLSPAGHGRLAGDGDEDAPEPCAARAGVPARDATGPESSGDSPAPGRAQVTQVARHAAPSRSAARCATGCWC